MRYCISRAAFVSTIDRQKLQIGHLYVGQSETIEEAYQGKSSKDACSHPGPE